METLNTNHLELAISAITLCVAIVCPVLVTIINSIHSTQIRKLELKYDKQISYYQKQQSLFNHFLEFASKQLETNYPSEKIEYIRSYHELFLYVPSEYWDQLSSLHDSLLNRKNDSSEKLLTVTQTLGKILQESDRLFPKL